MRRLLFHVILFSFTLHSCAGRNNPEEAYEHHEEEQHVQPPSEPPVPLEPTLPLPIPEPSHPHSDRPHEKPINVRNCLLVDDKTGVDDDSHGQSWSKPNKTIAFALERLRSKTVSKCIFVKKGTILVTGTILISSDVEIFGGFAEEMSPADRSLNRFHEHMSDVVSHNNVEDLFTVLNAEGNKVCQILRVEEMGKKPLHVEIDGFMIKGGNCKPQSLAYKINEAYPFLSRELPWSFTKGAGYGLAHYGIGWLAVQGGKTFYEGKYGSDTAQLLADITSEEEKIRELQAVELKLQTAENNFEEKNEKLVDEEKKLKSAEDELKASILKLESDKAEFNTEVLEQKNNKKEIDTLEAAITDFPNTKYKEIKSIEKNLKDFEKIESIQLKAKEPLEEVRKYIDNIPMPPDRKDRSRFEKSVYMYIDSKNQLVEWNYRHPLDPLNPLTEKDINFRQQLLDSQKNTIKGVIDFVGIEHKRYEKLKLEVVADNQKLHALKKNYERLNPILIEKNNTLLRAEKKIEDDKLEIVSFKKNVQEKIVELTPVVKGLRDARDKLLPDAIKLVKTSNPFATPDEILKKANQEVLNSRVALAQLRIDLSTAQQPKPELVTKGLGQALGALAAILLITPTTRNAILTDLPKFFEGKFGMRKGQLTFYSKYVGEWINDGLGTLEKVPADIVGIDISKTQMKSIIELVNSTYFKSYGRTLTAKEKMEIANDFFNWAGWGAGLAAGHLYANGTLVPTKETAVKSAKVTVGTILMLLGVESLYSRYQKSIGGGIYAKGAMKPLKIRNSYFEKNHAGYGGALFLDVDANSDVSIENSYFKENEAHRIDSSTSYSWAYGGAIYKKLGFLNINKVQFHSNKTPMNSAGGGGALYIDWGSTRVQESEFRDNEAFSGGAISHQDTGMYALTESHKKMELQIYDTVFFHNKAPYGSAIYGIYGTTKVWFSSFFQNTGGSQIYMYNGIDMRYSVVNGNYGKSLEYYSNKLGKRFSAASYLDVQKSCLDGEYKGVLKTQGVNSATAEILFEVDRDSKLHMLDHAQDCVRTKDHVIFPNDFPVGVKRKIEEEFHQKHFVTRGAVL